MAAPAPFLWLFFRPLGAFEAAVEAAAAVLPPLAELLPPAPVLLPPPAASRASATFVATPAPFLWLFFRAGSSAAAMAEVSCCPGLESAFFRVSAGTEGGASASASFPPFDEVGKGETRVGGLGDLPAATPLGAGAPHTPHCSADRGLLVVHLLQAYSLGVAGAGAGAGGEAGAAIIVGTASEEEAGGASVVPLRKEGAG